MHGLNSFPSKPQPQPKWAISGLMVCFAWIFHCSSSGLRGTIFAQWPTVEIEMQNTQARSWKPHQHFQPAGQTNTPLWLSSAPHMEIVNLHCSWSHMPGTRASIHFFISLLKNHFNRSPGGILRVVAMQKCDFQRSWFHKSEPGSVLSHVVSKNPHGKELQ